MKQAIEERFILDVLKAYTPVDSYYKLIKRIEDDPEFDAKRANKKLRKFVESHDHAIRLKAEIMVDHFHNQVIASGKIGGQARAMIITNGIERAIQYYHAVKEYLVERKSPYQAMVAFSGEPEYKGIKVSEASLNGFSSNDIADRIQNDPYRFLICANKFQTGYDEPLLHTMYVDKPLAGIQAVQTLSRLNRAHPQKHDCFVLDFQNNSESITLAFQDYYRTTILSEETDPNKLHDLKAALDDAQVYAHLIVDEYQDCSIRQHAIIYYAAEVLPTCLLGDPMQAIFGFGNDAQIKWDDVCAHFPLVGELSTPWRWRNVGTEPLGRWLLDVRCSLLRGQPVDLRSAPANMVNWVELDGTQD